MISTYFKFFKAEIEMVKILKSHKHRISWKSNLANLDLIKESDEIISMTFCRRGDTEEWSDNEKCTIKITCSQPHMLVK